MYLIREHDCYMLYPPPPAWKTSDSRDEDVKIMKGWFRIQMSKRSALKHFGEVLLNVKKGMRLAQKIKKLESY